MALKWKQVDSLSDCFEVPWHGRASGWQPGMPLSPCCFLSMPGNLVLVIQTLAVSVCLPFVSPQRQLGKNIKFGQRPSNAIPMKKAGSTDASSEEDFVLTSPMEIVTQQDIVPSDTENKVSLLQGEF